MNNKYKWGIVITIIIFYVILSYGKIAKNNNDIKSESVPSNNRLSIMLETGRNTGTYKPSSDSAWPTMNYAFNEDLSYCENESTLTWNDDEKTISLKGNKSDKCYMYFDKIITLAEYVKAQYTGTQGDNNMHYHDGTLENGAKDNSYRYAGDTPHNFVCFGYDSTDGTCPTDYLYRIIGVFDNQVKLIKYDYAKSTLLGTDGDYISSYYSFDDDNLYGTNHGNNSKKEIGVYYWNYKATNSTVNTWSTSLLNKTNLNTNYLNNIGTNWSNKIANHTWKVGGNTSSNIYNVPAPNTYANEIIAPAEETTYDAKIGLMYASDYGFAVSPSSWTMDLGTYNNSSTMGNAWMWMGLTDWTITRCSEDSNNVFSVRYVGNVIKGYTNNSAAIRPVFYLTPKTVYKSGIGTISSPILLS